MNDTESLIRHLAGQARPVKRLGSPWRRMLVWMTAASAVLALVVVSSGLRPQWWQQLHVPGAALEWGASVATGVLAAVAVFLVSVPGRSARWAWLPLPAALLWLASIGLGCLRDVAELGTGALAYQGVSGECARAIVLASIPLGLLMLAMVRHAGVLRPAVTALLTALAAAALSSAAVAMIHEGDTALMSLLWHFGVVLGLSAACGAFGRHLFGWLGYAGGKPRIAPPVDRRV